MESLINNFRMNNPTWIIISGRISQLVFGKIKLVRREILNQIDRPMRRFIKDQAIQGGK